MSAQGERQLAGVAHVRAYRFDEAEADGAGIDMFLPVAEGKPRANGSKATARQASTAAPVASEGPDITAPAGRTDTANGRRFIAQHGANVRWCEPWHKWLVWDGRRWEVDSRRQAESLAKQTADTLWREVGDKLPHVEAGTRAAMVKFAGETADARGIANMLAMAKSEPGVPILPEQFDAHPWLFNCTNGVVDLKTGERLPHKREQFLTKLCPHEYLLGAEGEAPLWELTVDRIFGGKPDLIGFVRRLVGLAMVGEVIEHMLPVLWGCGSNGKSLLVETLLAAMGGDYASKAPADLLLASHRDKHPCDKVVLWGKRLVVCSETDDGRRFAEAALKELSGNDTVTARRMREDFWTFRPSHTLMLVTNHKPIVRGQDHGVWRRLRLVPFTQTFWHRSKGESGPADMEANSRLSEELRPELAGIVRWLVDACREWQRDGLGQPAEVTEATADYRDAMDVLAAFVAECCNFSEEYTVKASDLRTRYAEWCKENGEKPVSGRRFGEYLAGRGVVKRVSNGTWYSGITIL